MYIPLNSIDKYVGKNILSVHCSQTKVGVSWKTWIRPVIHTFKEKKKRGNYKALSKPTFGLDSNGIQRCSVSVISNKNLVIFTNNGCSQNERDS